MIFPWRTDAPIYHFPFATIGLIVVNWLVFACAFQESVDLEPYILHYGDGLQPVQWVTSNFIHADLMHLLSNMLFLWSFGLIVEGKLGWWRFLLVYFGIGIAECAFEQAVTQGLRGGGSLGASSIVFGLMAISLVWAPKNELTCLVFLGFRPFTWEVPILAFSLLYIGIEVAMTALAGNQISSGLLHLFGIGFGFAVGIGLLKLDWVDCEGWDLFNVLRGREQEAQLERRKHRGTDDEIPVKIDPAGSLAHLASMAKSGHAGAVLALYQRLRLQTGNRPLPKSELVQLIAAMHEQKAWTDSVPLMVDVLRMYPENTARVRLRLGQILLLQENRPNQAIRVLKKIAPSELPANLEATRQQMLARADQLRDEGELELQAEDW